MSQILPPVIRKTIKWFLTFIRADKVGTTPSTVSHFPVASSHLLPGREFQLNETGKMNMHPNLQALTQLPPPIARTIHGDIPIYYLQVPAHCVTKIRGQDAPDPPTWGAGQGEPDADGLRTWKLLFEKGSVIYIRSQPVPNTGPGIHVITPNGTERFIPESLLTFDITYLATEAPEIPPMASTPGPSGVMTLLSPHATVAFEGRTCKACKGNDVHTSLCPTLQSDDYVCPWCNARGGSHSFRCNGFL